jgi:hypothetical protein
MKSRDDRSSRWANAAVLVAFVMLLVAPAGCVSVDRQPSAEAPPQQATVSFSSYPNGAEVLVDGQFRGTVPVNLHLTQGTHTVELRLEGHRPWKRELVVVAGDDTRVGATLQPE